MLSIQISVLMRFLPHPQHCLVTYELKTRYMSAFTDFCTLCFCKNRKFNKYENFREVSDNKNVHKTYFCRMFNLKSAPTTLCKLVFFFFPAQMRANFQFQNTEAVKSPSNFNFLYNCADCQFLPSKTSEGKLP